MIINGNIRMSIQNNYVSVEIEDIDASVRFLEIRLTPEQFTKMFHISTDCIIKISGLDKMGKTMEHEQFEFEISCGIDSQEREKVAKGEVALILKNTEWEPDLNFDSQSSFFTKDGKNFARTTIRRWVNKDV